MRLAAALAACGFASGAAMAVELQPEALWGFDK